MDVLFQEARSHFMLGQNAKAEELYDEFIERTNAEVARGVKLADGMRAELAKAYNNRGQIKYLRVDFTDAVQDYTSALQVDGDFAPAYYNRGQIHYRLGRFQKGIDDFQLALKYQPDFPDAALGLKTAQEDAQRSRMRTDPNITMETAPR